METLYAQYCTLILCFNEAVWQKEEFVRASRPQHWDDECEFCYFSFNRCKSIDELTFLHSQRFSHCVQIIEIDEVKNSGISVLMAANEASSELKFSPSPAAVKTDDASLTAAAFDNRRLSVDTWGRWDVGNRMRAEGRLNICCWRRNSRCSDGSKRGERGRARGSVVC